MKTTKLDVYITVNLAVLGIVLPSGETAEQDKDAAKVIAMQRVRKALGKDKDIFLVFQETTQVDYVRPA